MGRACEVEFARAFARLWGLTVGWVRALGVSPGDAEDVAASLWLALYDRWEEVVARLEEGGLVEERWRRLRALLRLYARRFAWRWRRDVRPRWQELTAEPPAGVASPRPDAERLVATRQALEGVGAELAALDATTRAVFLAVRLDDDTGVETARRHGLSEAGVRRRVRAVDARLGRHLAG